MRTAHRGVLGGIAVAAIATALGTFLATTAPADPSTLTLAASDATVGGTIHATAQLSESPGAEGEISFEVFAPGDPTCAGPALTPAPTSATVSGEGQYLSGNFTTAGAGTYKWSAHYTGDLVNPPADATCAAISTVSKASPGLTGSASSAVVGNAIHDEVSVSGGFSPGGEVSFSVFAPSDTTCTTPLATGSAAIQSAHATSADFISTQAGGFRWTASYPGDANNEAASLPCNSANQSSAVSKASPTLSGAATTAVTVGQTITDSATLAAGFSPGGNLTFRAYGPGDSTCATTPKYEATVAASGNGAYSPAGFAPAPGLYRWTVEYAGDANNETFALGCNAANQSSTVSKASPGLTGSASSAVVGKAIHDEVSLTGGFSPSGEVTFSVYAPADTSCTTPLETGAVAIQSAHATSADFTTTQAGAFRWTASYAGDANNEAASLPCNSANQSSAVGKASPTLSGVATSTVTVGQTITDSATLATGFSPGGNLIFRAYGPGDSTCATTPKYEATVAASGNGAYSPAGFAPAPGLYRWTVEYAGDANNEAFSLGCNATNQSSTVKKATPGLTGSASSAVVGNAIHDEVSVSGGFSPGGEVSFSVFAPADTTCATPLATGSVAILSAHATSADFIPQQAGGFRWTASYPGDANNEGFSLTCNAANQTSAVGKASPTLSGIATSAVTVGQSITDSVTLAAGFSPGGNLVFRAYGPGDSTCATTPKYEATVAVNGNGPYSPPGFSPAPGLYRWTVNYGGNANNETFALGCNAANQSSTVNKASPALTGNASAAVVGKAIHDEVSLTGGSSPSGKVTFSVFAPTDTLCATPLATSSVTIQSAHATSTDFLPQETGGFRWTASYPGDANNEAISLGCNAANQTSTVSKASPALSGSASSAIVGNAIHDEVSLTGGFSPSGEVTFSVYAPTDTLCATPLETSTVAIQSAHATSADFIPQQAGAFRWTASYPGDANNEAAALACSAAKQSSTVGKASPTLTGVATSVTEVGQTITDTATLATGFSPGGSLVFRAYGPGDPTCATPAKYEATVPVSGNGPYSPAGYAPARGLYRWTVEYEGDANNQAFSLGCNAANQFSTVGMVDVTLTASASGATVGNPVTATATIKEGGTPTGQLTFKAFPSSDPSCSSAPIFSSIVSVAGNGSYRSAPFLPSRVDNVRWTVAYSGDAHHAPAAVSCGTAISSITQAKPSIAGAVTRRVYVGAAIRDTAILQGGYTPGGTVTFRIYGPDAADCTKPLLVDIVAVRDNGTVSSDPFTPQRAGRYRFVASYSGDAANQAATEGCDSPNQVTQARKHTPRVKPRGVLIGRKTISIRARLSGGASPSGAISFRLYRPGDERCTRRPAFSGAISVKSNGAYSLAQYLATKRGVYRLSVSYSGDQRNQRYRGSCSSAQPIRVG